MTPRPRILLVGIDPNVIDYSTGPLAGYNAPMIMQVLEAGRAKFGQRDLQADMCLVDYGETAEAVLSQCLAKQQPYDCVVIGAGVREMQGEPILFEKVINLIHRQAPSAAIAFNTKPDDSLEAALRWLPKA